MITSRMKAVVRRSSSSSRSPRLNSNMLRSLVPLGPAVGGGFDTCQIGVNCHEHPVEGGQLACREARVAFVYHGVADFLQGLENGLYLPGEMQSAGAAVVRIGSALHPA